MATIRRLEDLDAWKKARRLVSDVYAHTRTAKVKSDLGYCDQIQRAAMSTMSNIAEGFGRQSDNEFAQFLNISKGSACEVSMLHSGLDIGYLTGDEHRHLQATCKETILLVGKMQGHLQRSMRSARL